MSVGEVGGVARPSVWMTMTTVSEGVLIKEDVRRTSIHIRLTR